MKRPVNDTERSWLGLDAPISRRDFLNGSLAVAGSALAPPAGAAVADTFTGYGGVGDYCLSQRQHVARGAGGASPARWRLQRGRHCRRAGCRAVRFGGGGRRHRGLKRRTPLPSAARCNRPHPDSREPCHAGWRGQAERIRRRGDTPAGSAGLERLRPAGAAQRFAHRFLLRGVCAAARVPVATLGQRAQAAAFRARQLFEHGWLSGNAG